MTQRHLRIVILGAGAGGMYCGSCLRDNTLAGTLKRLGHDVVLVPLFTSLRVDGRKEAEGEVFYGGVNVYLQHASGVFRHTPRMLDWLLDRAWVLNAAANYGSGTPTQKLGSLTRDILRAEFGGTAKELRRLIEHLRPLKPDVVSLPNLMFMGTARALHEELGAAVVCELTGEDIFLEAMDAQDQAACQALIRQAVGHVAGFVATSRYYAAKMAAYLGLQRGRVEVVYPGVEERMLAREDELAARVERGGGEGRGQAAGIVGYLARVCPEKGLANLVQAMELVRRRPGLGATRLLWGGYLGAKDTPWHDELLRRVARTPGWAEHRTNLEWDQKLAMLDQMELMSVPGVHPEPKGIYLLEAWARGLPVVQPAHGSYVELMEATGGGLLVNAGDAAALASGLAELLEDREKRARLGRAGWEAIREKFLDRHMARGMLLVYERAIETAPPT